MLGQQVQINLASARGQQQHHQQQPQVALGHSGMDPQFTKMRVIMHGRIVEYLRETKFAARQSLEQLANRLENEMFRLHPMKADYYVMLKEPTEQLVRTTVRDLSTHGQQHKKMLNQTQTSSIYGTVVPPHDAMSNEYWDPSTCIQQNSTTSSISPVTFPVSMQRQVTHMIATPGFSHQHTLRANPEFLNVARYLNGNSNDVAQIQQKQQKSFSVQQPSNHINSEVHSRMLENFSSCDLSDPQINDGMELHGSNMLLKNRAAVSEASMNLRPCCTYPDKALKQEFNLPTSSGISVSENVYNTVSSVLTTKRTNSGLFVRQTTKQQLQPKPCKKSEVLDGRERSKLSEEQLLKWPHQLKPNRPCSQYVQNQEVLKQCQLGSYSKETGDNEKRDQMSGQLPLQNIHTGVPSDSQHLLAAHMTNTIWMNNKIQDDCCQGTMSQDLAQQPVSSDWLRAGCSMNSIDHKLSELPTKGPEQIAENIKCYYLQLRWLLLLIHAKSCPGPLSGCKSQYCVGAQDVLKHFKNCQRKDCSYRYCRQSKMLIAHYRNCVDKHCPVCSKAKESLHHYANQSNKCSHPEPTFNMDSYTIERVIDGIYGDRMDTKLVAVETFDDQPPVSKRIKQSMYPNVSDGVDVPVPQACSELVLQKAHPKHFGQDKRRFPKQELNMKTDIQLPQNPAIISFGTVEKIGAVQSYSTPGIPSKLDSHFEDALNIKSVDVLDMKNANGSTDVMLSKTGKTKTKGISLMEIFTPEQVYEHIFSLRQWVGQDDCCQGTMSQDLAQQPVSSDWLRAGCSMNSIDHKLSELPTKGPEQIAENIKCYYLQLRWLLLLIHAKSCPGPLSGCKSQYCVGAQDVLKHFKNCQRKDCSYRYCRQSKMLIAHYRNCVDKHCPVCSKAKESLHHYANQSNKCSHPEPTFNMDSYTIERVIDGIYGDRMDTKLVAVETFDDQPPVSKRIKQSMYPNVSDGVDVPVPQACSELVLQKAHPKHFGQDKRRFPKQELNMKTDIQLPQNPAIISFGTVEKIGAVQSYSTPGIPSKLDSHFEDALNIKSVDVLDMKNANGSTDVMLSKTGKTKTKGISLMEIFTPEQVYEHIFSLRQWVGQSKAKAEKNQAMGHSKNENSCQLCKLERLTFEPPPIYCSPCGSRIKQNAPYYIATISESGRYNFCVPCYTESRSDSIFVGSIQLLKSKLEKRRNDDELEEGWVACDKCKRWQHQICALFNAKRNDEEKEAEFTCHYCYIQEIKHGLRAPLSQSTVLGAKDLPRTLLSDHIEERLFKRLKEERQDRAKKNGQLFDEVPGVEGLVVRVVSSVDKKLEVKPQFLEIFQEENYPTEFPYKSKAILLFQRIDGVEVCIFGMYVQEFGAECAFPNQRRVYLSYLDSVKYFRPEIETVSGEALRTFVYHEILIGYLQYCKQLGFTSCYIWACPPLKGEDYIMYCHPEIQKTPKSDKLREWYLSMLQKASKEGIVVERTNLYDHFFIRKRECKAKVTAARLPYFDGDYWPGAAEDMLSKICLPEGDRNVKKNRKKKSSITKRDLEAAGVTDLCGSASKDAMLMQKLGELIYPMKEDFIMVHLQYSCSHCCILMMSGRRWKCNQCKSFYICDKCYIVEWQREEKDRHPSNSTDLHMLHEVQIVGVPEDAKDRDDIIESEFFDTRQAFLSLCQGNHYQYDTLRSAKHSSMMVLYHLHNPTEPAFVTTCNVCDNDIKTGQGWRCEQCDYDECAACYQEYGGMNHVHRLTKHSAGADRDIQNIRQKRVQTARVMLEILTHAMACRVPRCQHHICRKIKALFLHGTKCQQRVSGGCTLCKKLWGIIHFHARVCKESQCRVPRCRDVKEHMRRLQQESESRRRVAVNEMMRQRAAEVKQ